METLSIASKTPFAMKLIEATLSKDWRVESSPANTLVVHGANGRAYAYPDVETGKDGTYRLLLDYSDVQLAKKLLEKIANDPDLTVDNDFGTVLPGNEFVARCKAEEGWDWRQEPAE